MRDKTMTCNKLRLRNRPSGEPHHWIGSNVPTTQSTRNAEFRHTRRFKHDHPGPSWKLYELILDHPTAEISFSVPHRPCRSLGLVTARAMDQNPKIRKKAVDRSGPRSSGTAWHRENLAHHGGNGPNVDDLDQKERCDSENPKHL